MSKQENSKSSQWRLLNPDGTFNVSRAGLHKYSRTDFYHNLLLASWPRFLSYLVVTYIGINSLFAVLFVLCGPEALSGIQNGSFRERFLETFFFSVQTFSTIGYGKITPISLTSNILVTIEALTGLLSIALATGLVFARFSKPTSRVVFSRTATITTHDGLPAFIFRLANVRLNQIVEAQMRLTILLDEFTKEGDKYRNFHVLNLEHSITPVFTLSWTAVHPIDQESPLFGLNADDLRRLQAEILVSVVGIDETFSQTIHARHSYTVDDIAWNKSFKDILSRKDGLLRIDLEHIHDFQESVMS